MRYGLNYTYIGVESVFDYFLAVARDSGAFYLTAGILSIEFGQEFLYRRYGVAAV